VGEVLLAINRDLNVILARGVRRMFGIALAQYRRALEERSLLDFSEVQQRALDLLRQMDEFAQSRFRLESRYHHVLVDEFQDTSRAQWELVSLLVGSWGEGAGLVTSPSIFIVGDRKQSIYRFRDADVTVLRDAAGVIESLRPGTRPRRAIRRSFRALPGLLEFVNDLFTEMGADAQRADDFSYGDTDRFPVDELPERGRGPVLGINAGEDAEACARAVASEIRRLLREESVRDRITGVPRTVAPGDIAILFRSRTSHREFQRELEAAGVPAYVYKGLGFFDADETKDVVALIRYLARPESDLRAAAFLRSRLVRLSDPALTALGPDLAAALLAPAPPEATASLNDEDRRVLEQARRAVGRWLPQVDRVPPADLIESILDESVYARELGGPRQAQAWENLKKMRALIRRIQNRGYATLLRIADHIDALSAGDESNAVLEAVDAVNLMTVHASKGLEFPIVFVVNIGRGANAPPRPVRVVTAGLEEPSVSIGPFVSDSDEMDRERERHETRRLLYVALTRARDRLYLSAMLKKGALVPGRGSLAEVLPDSVRELFGRAATAFPECPTVAWTSSAGRVFEWRICRPPLAPVLAHDATRHELGHDQLDPLPAEPAGEPVTRWIRTETGRQEQEHDVPVESRVAGMLVHRLFQTWGLEPRAGADQLALAGTLLRATERVDLMRPREVIEHAVAVWNRLRVRDDVRALLQAGERAHELPFTVVVEGRTLRGRIDCLVRGSDGILTVVDFKTGQPDELDRRQIDLYVRAVRAMCADSVVQGRIIHP
jgi:ATP-dependent exoDNAse (exonuclease V) beta subunit